MNSKNIKNNLLFGALVLSLSAPAQEGPQTSSEASPEQSVVEENISEEKNLEFLNDLGDVFTLEQEAALEEMLKVFSEQTDDQIVVITADSIGDFSTFDQYSLHLIDELEVGRKIDENGIVLIFSSELRKIHLNTEFEVEKKVSDATYEEVVKEVIIPKFEEGDHYAGVQQGLEKIIAAWKEQS